jgi:hypothetical protein
MLIRRILTWIVETLLKIEYISSDIRWKIVDYLDRSLKC